MSERYAQGPGLSWEYEPRRTEGCACGGLISADPSNSRLVSAAVQAHQRQLRHVAWSGRQGFPPRISAMPLIASREAAPTMEVSSQPKTGAAPMTLLRRAV